MQQTNYNNTDYDVRAKDLLYDFKINLIDSICSEHGLNKEAALRAFQKKTGVLPVCKQSLPKIPIFCSQCRSTLMESEYTGNEIQINLINDHGWSFCPFCGHTLKEEVDECCT